MLWSCSLCTFVEVNHRINCRHSEVLNECITEVSSVLSCSREYLISSMIQSAAFNHIPDLSVACFYGSRKRHEFSVLRQELRDRRAPITSGGRINIVKRLAGTRGWRCLNRSCAGVSQACSHLKSVEVHVQQGQTHCFSSIHDLLGLQKVDSEIEEGEPDTQLDLLSLSPGYSRPLVPSDLSFQVNFNVIKNAHNGTHLVPTAASSCQCGMSLEENGSRVSVHPLRVETARCFVEYQQEIWKCRNGHIVTPEHETRTREGYVWISRFTAFTEVFLFDLLLHMTVGGATLSSQSELRAQLLSLQTEYMSRDMRPRSPQSVRRALIIYARAVVQDIPSWVFRFSNCVEITDGKVYYTRAVSPPEHIVKGSIRESPLVDLRMRLSGTTCMKWNRTIVYQSNGLQDLFGIPDYCTLSEDMLL